MRRRIWIGPVGVLLVWLAVTRLGFIAPIFLPGPASVFRTLYSLFSTGSILPDLGLTVARWIAGLTLGVSLGIPVGLLMGCSRRVYDSLEVVVDFFRSIPVMALFPLALVLFGIGDKSKVFLAAWAALLYVVINSMYGARHAKEPRIMAARVFGATPWQVFAKVILPDALPNVFVGIRMSISMSLVIVVASEMVMGTEVGLGLRVFDAALVYRMSEMYAVVIVAGALGYLSNKLFMLAEARVIHWAAK